MPHPARDSTRNHDGREFEPRLAPGVVHDHRATTRGERVPALRVRTGRDRLVELFCGIADAGLEDEPASVRKQLEDAHEIRAEGCRDDPARLFEQLLPWDVGERQLADAGNGPLLLQPSPELCARRDGRLQGALDPSEDDNGARHNDDEHAHHGDVDRRSRLRDDLGEDQHDYDADE